MRFGVLGPLQAHDDEGGPIAIPPAKPGRLLALLLACGNEAISADRLVDLLWAGEPPQSARSNVQVYIHRLRRVLGEDRIEHRDGGYRLLAQSEESDAGRFESLASRGAYREALGLWRGEAYAGMTDLELVREEAARLTELQLSTLEKRIEDDLGHGAHAHLIPELSSLVARHSLRERFWAQLMLALYRAGRASEALDAYRDLRDRMVDELGIEPGRPLRELQQAVLNEDHTLDLASATTTEAKPHPVPAELPPAVGTFTGRTRELDRIGDALSGCETRSVPIVTVAGPGGIGKSALAVQAAHNVAAEFPDGQLYVNLQGATPGVQPMTPRDALDRLLRSVGDANFDTPGDVGEASGRLRTLTAGRRLLVVLDDVVDDAQVRPLLPGGTQSAVLITSRSVLTSLDGALSHQLGALSSEESVVLLARITGMDRLQAEPDAADELVRLCDHLPLALCIAGAKLVRRRNWPVRELVRRMTDEQRRLDELSVPDRAVRTSFAVSSADLGDDAARMFRLLGLVPGPDLGVPAAAALADRTESEAEALLDQLVDAQLADSPAPGRYHLHDLLRLFAREQAQHRESETERTDAVRRAFHWYLATALGAELVQTPDSWRQRFVPAELVNPGCRLVGDAEIGDWLSTEIANLVASARHAATLPKEGPLLATAFAAVLFTPMNTRGRWYELRELIEVGLHATRDEDLSDHRALLHNDLGWIHALLGNPDQALPYLERALSHWQGVGDRRGEATTTRVYARALGALGRDEEALEYARAALQMFREIDVRVGQMDSLLAIGLQSAQLGRLGEAIAAHEEGITIAERYGDLWHAGVLIGNAADLHRRAGHLSRAVAEFERALGVDHESGNAATYFEAEHLWGLGRAVHEQGDSEAARRYWDRSAGILRDLGLIGAEEFDSLMTVPVPEAPDVIARQL